MNKVGIIMGSKSDMDIAAEAVRMLKELEIDFEIVVSSAHRTPRQTSDWSLKAKDRGIGCIIAFAGAAAHLAGVVAAETNIPVIAVPISATTLSGLDALYSMVQMPGGIPVAVMSIGKPGAKNAALFACQILALHNSTLYEKLEQYREDMAQKIQQDNDDIMKIVAEI